jgi:UDP-glucose 4-epimerase
MRQKDKKILVTGGAGFIGSNLVPQLLEKGYSVVVLDNLSTGKLENLKIIRNNPHFSFKRVDILNRNAVKEAFCEVDKVVHLAALIDISASVADPSRTHDVNVTGTLNVLQEAALNKVTRFVFASSTAVYGDTTILPVKEDTVLKPISPYAASKVAGEAYCSAFANCYGFSTIALRFFNVFGLRNENSPYSGVITKFLRKAVHDEELLVEGDGEQTRDFIHVNDVASAILLALESEITESEVFNVCTGIPTSINGLVETLREVTGKKLRVKHGPPRVGDIRSSYGDPAKALKQLKFKSKINLPRGLNMLLEAFK